MVEVTKIGNKTLVMDGKILSLFRKGSLLRQMYYGGYEDFDGANGGVWKKYIHIPITTVPLENATYRIVIDSTDVSIYNIVDGLKAKSSIASEFWSLVRSDGFDIRAFDHLFNQLWFWVEYFDYDSQKAIIVVNLPKNTRELNIAFGNPQALSSDYDDYTKVATVVVDDFEDGDTSDWVVDSEGSADNFYADSVVKRFGNYSGHLKDSSSDARERHYKQFSSLTEDFTIEFWLLAQSLGTTDVTYDKITLSLQDSSLTVGAHTPSVEVSPQQFVYYDGGWKALTDLTLNTWYKLKTNFRFSDQTYDVAVYDNEGNLLASASNISFVNSVSEISVFYIYSWLRVTCDINIDQILIYKITDPATFDTPRIVEF